MQQHFFYGQAIDFSGHVLVDIRLFHGQDIHQPPHLAIDVNNEAGHVPREHCSGVKQVPDPLAQTQIFEPEAEPVGLGHVRFAKRHLERNAKGAHPNIDAGQRDFGPHDSHIKPVISDVIGHRICI